MNAPDFNNAEDDENHGMSENAWDQLCRALEAPVDFNFLTGLVEPGHDALENA